MKKSYQILRGLWTLAAVALVGGLAGCKPDTPEVPTIPSLDIKYGGATNNSLTLSYDDAGKIKPENADSFFEVDATRDWALTKSPSTASWVTATPVSGKAGSPTKVTVTVSANSGEMQSATLIIKTTDGSAIERRVTINQDGTTPVVTDATPIADFRAYIMPKLEAAGGDSPTVTLDAKVVFAGVVVSDGSAAGGNIEDYLFALQDDTKPNSGVVINLNDHKMPVGAYVKVECDTGRKAKLFNNLLQVEATTVTKLGTQTPEPVTVTFDNIRTYESQFVKVENVQLKADETATWNGSKVFTNRDYQTLTVYTKSKAAFQSQTVSTKSGYLLGLSGIYGSTIQLQPRNADDVSHLDQDRFPDQPVATEGKNILLQENMGTENSPSPYTNVNAWEAAGKFQKAGLGAATVVYSTPSPTGTADASVRYAAGSISSGYTKASAGNNVFFGGTIPTTFLISDISLGGTNVLYLGMGYNNTSANLNVTYQEDGGEWKPLTLTSKVSTSWDYLVTPLTVTAGTELLSLKFVVTNAEVKSTLRIDDIYVTTDQTYAQVYIPAVTTGESTVAGKNVTMNGSMTYEGQAADITEYGFAYGTSETAMTQVTATAGATFSKTVEALDPGNYSWYAYVKKGGKTYEGATKTFTIDADQMTTVTIQSIVGDWNKDGLIAPGKQIKGTIVSDRTGANYSSPDSSFMIVDGTGDSSGMFIYQLKQDDGTTNATHTFNAGDQVIVDISSAKMAEYNGLRQLTGVKLSGVTPDTSGTTKYDAPLALPSAADLEKYQSMLVKIDCGPAAGVAGTTWGGSKNFTDSRPATFTVYTNSAATFASAVIPSASGSITGIVSFYNAAQLSPRNLNDIVLGTVVPQFSVSTQAVPVPAAGGNATVNVTANVGWTAAVNAGGNFIIGGPTPANGTGNATITLVFAENTDQQNEKVVTMTITAAEGSGVTPASYTVVFTQAKASSGGAAQLLFPGSDFNNWSTFLASLNTNGLLNKAGQSTNGGRDGSGALQIKTTISGNDYVFTATAPNPAVAPTKTISFYIKGTATGKSLSMNVYKENGTNYHCFNLDVCTADVTLQPSSGSSNTSNGTNSYAGSINTGGNWVKVTMNVQGLSLAGTSGNIFALKVGKDGVYDLLIDDITYE